MLTRCSGTSTSCRGASLLSISAYAVPRIPANSTAYPNVELTPACVERYHAAGAFEAAQAYIGKPVAQARTAIPALTGCAEFVAPFATIAYARVAALARSQPPAYRQVDAAVNGRRSTGFAPIVALAYPRITPAFTENRGYCAGLDLGELRFLDEFTNRLNAQISQAVADTCATGIPILYADIADALQAGRTACDRQAHVVTASSASPADLLRPDRDGYRAMTAALVRWSTRPDVTGLILERKVPGTATIPKGQSAEGTVAVAPVPPPGTPQRTTGSVVTVTGTGFGPGQPVTVTIPSGAQAAGAGLVPQDGRLAVAAALPDDLTPGTQTLLVTSWAADGRPLWAYAVTTAEPPVSIWQIVTASVAVLLAVTAVVIWWLWRRRRRRLEPEEET